MEPEYDNALKHCYKIVFGEIRHPTNDEIDFIAEKYPIVHDRLLQKADEVRSRGYNKTFQYPH